MKQIPANYEKLRIQPGYFQEGIQELNSLMRTGDWDVSRPTFSQRHQSMRDWLMSKAQQLGLEIRVDGVKNHSVYLDCGPKGSKALLIGAHLDSDPLIGRYNQFIGVLAALEIIRVIKDEGIQLPFNIEVVDFTGPIGSQHIRLGSDALAGKLTNTEIVSLKEIDPEFPKSLDAYNLDISALTQAGKKVDQFVGFLGLYLDHGNVLDETNQQVGIIKKINGKRTYRVFFKLFEEHPVEDTKDVIGDTSIGANAFSLSVRKHIENKYKNCSVNFGQIQYYPGKIGKKPTRVDVFVELRALDEELLDRLELEMKRIGKLEADKNNVDFEVETLQQRKSISLSENWKNVIMRCTDQLGYQPTVINSFIDFDGTSMNSFCPVGIILAPNYFGSNRKDTTTTNWKSAYDLSNIFLQSILEYAFTVFKRNNS